MPANEPPKQPRACQACADKELALLELDAQNTKLASALILRASGVDAKGAKAGGGDGNLVETLQGLVDKYADLNARLLDKVAGVKTNHGVVVDRLRALEDELEASNSALLEVQARNTALEKELKGAKAQVLHWRLEHEETKAELAALRHEKETEKEKKDGVCEGREAVGAKDNGKKKGKGSKQKAQKKGPGKRAANNGDGNSNNGDGGSKKLHTPPTPSDAPHEPEDKDKEEADDKAENGPGAHPNNKGTDHADALVEEAAVTHHAQPSLLVGAAADRGAWTVVVLVCVVLCLLAKFDLNPLCPAPAHNATAVGVDIAIAPFRAFAPHAFVGEL